VDLKDISDSIAIGASDANGHRNARRGEAERAGCLPKLIFWLQYRYRTGLLEIGIKAVPDY